MHMEKRGHTPSSGEHRPLKLPGERSEVELQPPAARG